VQGLSEFPIFKKERNLALYCPIMFNYRGIDGIIVRFDYSGGKTDKSKCFMFPLQVTLAKPHSDSEQKFFNEWSMWTKYLDDFDVVVEFLWITTEGPSAMKVSRDPRLRGSEDRSEGLLH
jgi:hypothetical protein